MAIKETITQSQFIDAFRSSDFKKVHSYEGLKALYNHLWDYSEDVRATSNLMLSQLIVITQSIAI